MTEADTTNGAVGAWVLTPPQAMALIDNAQAATATPLPADLASEVDAQVDRLVIGDRPRFPPESLVPATMKTKGSRVRS
jgi:hypothetical protein